MRQLIRRKRVQSVLNEDLQEALILALKCGLPQDRVADACGVDRDTLQEWLERGVRKGASEPFRSFAVTWRQTEAAMMGSVMAAYGRWAQSDWRASDAFLKLRFPEFNPELQGQVPPKALSHEEDMEQFRQVLKNPEEFGYAEEFAQYYVSKDKAEQLQVEIQKLQKELEAAKQKPKPPPTTPPKVKKR